MSSVSFILCLTTFYIMSLAAESLDGNTDFGDTSKIRSTVTLNEVINLYVRNHIC